MESGYETQDHCRIWVRKCSLLHRSKFQLVVFIWLKHQSSDLKNIWTILCVCLTSRGLGITGQPCCMMGVRRGAGLEEERERERRCTGTNTLQMHCILAIVNTRDSACKCNYACCGGVIHCARAPLPWYGITYTPGCLRRLCIARLPALWAIVARSTLAPRPPCWQCCFAVAPEFRHRRLAKYRRWGRARIHWRTAGWTLRSRKLVSDGAPWPLAGRWRSDFSIETWFIINKGATCIVTT